MAKESTSFFLEHNDFKYSFQLFPPLHVSIGNYEYHIPKQLCKTLTGLESQFLSSGLLHFSKHLLVLLLHCAGLALVK